MDAQLFTVYKYSSAYIMTWSRFENHCRATHDGGGRPPSPMLFGTEGCARKSRVSPSCVRQSKNTCNSWVIHKAETKDTLLALRLISGAALLTHYVYASYLNRENEFFVALVRLIALRLSCRRLSRGSYETGLKALTNWSNSEEK